MLRPQAAMAGDVTLAPSRKQNSEAQRSWPIHPLAWMAAAAAMVTVVFTLQISNRAPLLWDEAVRVSEGAAFSYAVRDGDWGEVWDWLNRQVFYPPLMPILHGMLFLVVGPVAAAWLPALLAYGAAGVLCGALARTL